MVDQWSRGSNQQALSRNKFAPVTSLSILCSLLLLIQSYLLQGALAADRWPAARAGRGGGGAQLSRYGQKDDRCGDGCARGARASPTQLSRSLASGSQGGGSSKQVNSSSSSNNSSSGSSSGGGGGSGGGGDAPAPSPPPPGRALAESQTSRVNPLKGFETYRGGWDLSSASYWQTLAWTGAPAYALALGWLLLGALTWLLLAVPAVSKCCCQGGRGPKIFPPSDSPARAYLLKGVAVLGLLLCLCAAGVLIWQDAGLRSDAREVSNAALTSASSAAQGLRHISATLLNATRVTIGNISLPQSVREGLIAAAAMAVSAASLEESETRSNASRVRSFFSSVRIVLFTVAAASALSVLLATASLLANWRRLCLPLAVGLWLLAACSLVLCGIYVLMFNLASDSQVAFREAAKQPQLFSASVKRAVPCTDANATRESIAQIRQTTFHIVQTYNRVAASTNRQLALISPLQATCSPFGGPANFSQLSVQRCPAGVSNISDTLQVVERLRCLSLIEYVCRAARLLPRGLQAEMIAGLATVQQLANTHAVLESYLACQVTSDAFQAMGPAVASIKKHALIMSLTAGGLSLAAMLAAVAALLSRRRHAASTSYEDSAGVEVPPSAATSAGEPDGDKSRSSSFSPTARVAPQPRFWSCMPTAGACNPLFEPEIAADQVVTENPAFELESQVAEGEGKEEEEEGEGEGEFRHEGSTAGSSPDLKLFSGPNPGRDLSPQPNPNPDSNPHSNSNASPENSFSSDDGRGAEFRQAVEESATEIQLERSGELYKDRARERERERDMDRMYLAPLDAEASGNVGEGMREQRSADGERDEDRDRDREARNPYSELGPVPFMALPAGAGGGSFRSGSFRSESDLAGTPRSVPGSAGGGPEGYNLSADGAGSMPRGITAPPVTPASLPRGNASSSFLVEAEGASQSSSSPPSSPLSERTIRSYAGSSSEHASPGVASLERAPSRLSLSATRLSSRLSPGLSSSLSESGSSPEDGTALREVKEG